MPRLRLAVLAALVGPCASSWHPLRRAHQEIRAFDRSVLGNLRNAGEVANPRMSRSHMFVADITVGTPPQTLSCLLDSGSADIWVPSKRCKNCHTQHSFRADKSKTFMPAIVHTPQGDMPVPVEVDGSGGQIVGFIVQDRVGLGPWVFENQSFLIVEESHLPRHRAWDGICGLGWRGLASSVQPLYRNLQKHQGYATFALVPSSPGQTYLVVGEVPDELHHTVAWAEAEPLGHEGKRSFWVASGGVGTNEQGPVRARFVIDTGTSFVLAPRKHYTKFLRSLIPRHLFDHLCGADPTGDNLIVCDCSIVSGKVAKNELTVYLGGRKFALPVHKLFKRVPTVDGGELCLLHVQQNSMTSVNPMDLLKALLGSGLGIAGDSANGNPLAGPPGGGGPLPLGGPPPPGGPPPGLILPPFLMPQGANMPPLPTDAEQVEEVTETRPDGKVCTTMLVWQKGHLKSNTTHCRGRRLQINWAMPPEQDELADMWVLGGAFLDHIVTVFDFENHRLGFGALVEGASPLEAAPLRPAHHLPPQQHQAMERQANGLRTAHAHRPTLGSQPPAHQHSSGGGGGSGWGALVFGIIVLSMAGCAAMLSRKMRTRKVFSQPVHADGEEGAELWEENDANVAVAE